MRGTLWSLGGGDGVAFFFCSFCCLFFLFLVDADLSVAFSELAASGFF